MSASKAKHTRTISITLEWLAEIIRQSGIYAEMPPEAELKRYACRPMMSGDQRDPHLAGIELVWTWEE